MRPHHRLHGVAPDPHGPLKGLEQPPVTPVLQLVLLSSLSQPEDGLTLTVQLVVEVIQQSSPRPTLQFGKFV